MVLGDPAIRFCQTAGQEVHAVGSREGQLGAVSLDEVGTFRGVHLLVLHVDTSAGNGIDGSRLARLEVGPGVVTDVMCAAGLVNSEKIDGAISISELDTDVVAIDGARPVGNAIGINLTAENADG